MMGEARRRGTFEQRRAEAVARNKKAELDKPKRQKPSGPVPAIIAGLIGLAIAYDDKDYRL